MPDQLERLAREVVERQATAHERVACPRCHAPTGEKCRGLPKGWRPPKGNGRKLTNSHVERLHADGLTLR